MSRKLTLFNGRLAGFEHGYIAAYSRADAVRIYEEFFGGRAVLPEIRDYWSEGSWGNQMIGVTPRRGMFAKTKDGSLVEIIGIGKAVSLVRDDPQAWTEYQKQEQARRDAYTAHKRQEYQEKHNRLKQFAGHYILPTPKDDAITVEYRGHRYEIREID